MKNTKLTLVTPVYIGNDSLKDMTENLYLESLCRCIEKDIFEVVLVDDNSPMKKDLEESVSKYKERGLNVRLIKNFKNMGFPFSVTRGIQENDSKYIAITNNDIYVPSGSIKRLVDIIKNDTAIAGIGPVTNNSGGYRAQQQAKLKIDNYDERNYKEIERIAKMKRESNGRITDVNWLTGFFMVLDRKKYNESGGMDKDYGLGYNEEVDLCIRLRKLGHLVVDEKSFVFHGHINSGKSFWGGASMSTIKYKAFFSFLKNLGHFSKKNGINELIKLAYDWHVRKDFPEYYNLNSEFTPQKF